MIVRLVAVLAALFGLATVAAGSRVLGGADPGYEVFRPLLIFNTLMGAVYLAAALVIWRDPRRGRRWAGAIALVNLAVLLAIGALRLAGAAIAVNSLAAMAFRTFAWSAAAVILWRQR